MTKKQISEIFDIPLSTLSEWSKPTHNKYKLYIHLINSSSNQVKTTLKKKHRLLHILNRNTTNAKYTIDEIKEAFDVVDYTCATQRQKSIYRKFFKECDGVDLNKLVNQYGISIRKVKNIYLNSPERAFSGVSRVWNRRFRIKNEPLQKTEIPFPSLLSRIVSRNSNV